MVEIQQLKFRVVDARTFRISGMTNSIIAHKKEKNIVSLELTDKVIPLGETVSFLDHKYKVNFIDKKESKGVLYYDLSVARPNISNMIILPMLGGTKKLFLYNKLVNCFINHKEYKDKIILVYEHTIKDFHEALLKFKNFVKYIKLEGRHKMYIFNPPTKYLKDYKEILKGKYSQISPEYKTKILDYNNFDITSAMGHILFQSKERKEKLEKDLGVELDDSAELFSILDMKLETFDSEYYGF